MATYNLKFNYDDSVLRHIIIGLCADLNKKIYIYHQRTQTERIKVDVPFYNSFAGDEDVLYDYFLLDDMLDPDKKKAIGNYDVIPRGIVNVESFNIDSGALINKFSRGYYQKEVDGQMKSFIAQFQMIPVVISCECKILVDNQLDMYRITEKLIKRLYKSNIFQVDVGHIEEGTYRIASSYSLPEDYEHEHPIEFSFDDDKTKSITFTLEIQSFIPAFEEDDEQFAGNRMFNIENHGIPVNDIDKDNLEAKKSKFLDENK